MNRMKYWRKFDIEFEATNTLFGQKNCFDAVFTPTKNDKTKVE